MSDLAFEAKFLHDHLAEWRRDHPWKYVLIKGETARFYNGLTEAFDAGIKAYGLEDFLIDQIIPKDRLGSLLEVEA